MKNKYKIIILIAIIVMLLNIISIAHTTSKITIVGSTSVQPLCEQLAEEYKKTHNNVDINVQGGGTSLGIKCANSSIANIGMSSKQISCNEMKEYEIGREGIVIIVNNQNPINDLSTKQIQKIFSGEIKNWNEITNKSGKINVIIREEGSGTLDSFKEVIMKNKSIKNDAIVQNSAGSIKQCVIQDENAISFVSLVHIDNSLKNISINGISPTNESIIDGSYKLQRPFILLADNNSDNQTQDFINWIMSDNAQKILDNEKIIRG